MKYVDDLFSPEELAEYNVTVYPFNLSLLDVKLKERLATEPDYEVWVPLVYYVYSGLKKSSNWADVFTPPNLFISNKGNVRNVVANSHRDVNMTGGVGDTYVVFSIGNEKRGRSLVLHRALACSFLPIDKVRVGRDKRFLAHPSYLEVNHIDGVKTNFALDNLEWSTSSGNRSHALSAGLIKVADQEPRTKPVKGVVLVGEYQGYSFILHGAHDYRTYGFGQPNIVACVKGRVKTHKNCSWSYATNDEVTSLPRGVPEHVQITIFGSSQKFSNLYY